MGSEVINEVNSIGMDHASLEEAVDEKCSQTGYGQQPSAGQNNRIVRALKRQRRFWMIGGGISLFPTFAVGLARFFLYHASVSTILRMLSSTSIMYTGVTLMVSAINDLDFASESQNVRDETDKLMWWYLIILLLCVIFYGIVEFSMNILILPTSKTQQGLATGFLIALNVLFVSVPAGLGWKQYGDCIKRAEGKGK